MFTMFAAKSTGGHARIVSFEPIPSTFAVLSANCASMARGDFDSWFKPAAGAKLDVRPHNVGLSDADANVRGAGAGNARAHCEAVVGPRTPRTHRTAPHSFVSCGLPRNCRTSLQVVFQHSPSLSIWSTNDASFAEQRKARFLVDVKRAVA